MRTLAVDIARKLNTGGCLSQLHRQYVEPWDQHISYSLERIVHEKNPENFLLPIQTALQHFPALTLLSS